MTPISIAPTKLLIYPIKPDKTEIEHPSFLAALTHELRNPLTNINLSVEMIRRLHTADDKELYLDIIIRAVDRINTVVTELAQKQQHEQENAKVHSVHQLLEEVLLIAGDRILLKHISVNKEYTIQDYHIKENRPEMKIALTNIIINAIDAIKEQEGILKLVTTSIDEQFILMIEDNGCGISTEDLKHIFQPFFTRKTGGLGIGLAVTYNILKENNVKIEVESQEGKGTKFILSFKKASPVFLVSKT